MAALAPAEASSQPPSNSVIYHVRAVARNAAASTLGASVVALVVTPLDVMKVRMQAHVCPVGGVAPCEDPGHVGGMRDALRKVVRADGVRGLWRGLSVTLALAVPTTGLYFSMYEAFMAQAAAIPAVGDGTAAMVSGAAARLVTATVASPMELARIRVQAGDRQGVLAIVRQVYRQDGARALWRGLGPTLMRDAPFSAIYWGAYEALKDPSRSPLPAKMLEREHKFSGYLVAGIGAGSLAAVVTVPADVIKTRRQALISSADRPAATLDIARAIYREEGSRGLFRGVGPRVVKVAPACAIMMGTYELFKVLLQ
jgi:solute carrier family 25, member 39/40